jgi:hypothetical protein
LPRLEAADKQACVNNSVSAADAIGEYRMLRAAQVCQRVPEQE